MTHLPKPPPRQPSLPGNRATSSGSSGVPSWESGTWNERLTRWCWVLEWEVMSSLWAISHHMPPKHRILLCRNTGVRPLWKHSRGVYVCVCVREREIIWVRKCARPQECGGWGGWVTLFLTLLPLVSASCKIYMCFIHFSSKKFSVVSRNFPICLRNTNGILSFPTNQAGPRCSF